MAFARWVFIGAGVWGVVVLTPLLVLADVTGRRYAAPHEYPQFFYGFITVALAWQVAFLVIGSHPVKFRALMPVAVLEKLGYVTVLMMLYAAGRIDAVDVQPAVPDAVLGVLFLAAFVRSKPPLAKHQ